ncbi:MAG: chorismate synthase [Firmicutes bacterium]|nr:chorismate synthase [Bacillota bacterium]
MSISFGQNLIIKIFGASHAPEVGVTVTGLPAGRAVDLAALQAFLDRRAPGSGPYVTQRKEADRPEFLSGIEGGVLTGEPLTAVIKNSGARSVDYEGLKYTPRPGHADYSAYVKYGAIPPGGGSFSGRMTAPLCIAGGICLQLLKEQGVSVSARIVSVGGVTEAEGGDAMLEEVKKAAAEGDSVGGVIECTVEGLPAGLGGPLFEGFEGLISQAVFAIPAVKGIEFGAGFAAAAMRGSENNDPFEFRDGRVVTSSNNCGGILGGISDGMPLTFRAAFKPTPSIAKPQKTVDLRTMSETVISVGGRHDPCVSLRAVPAVEAAAAIAVYDAMLSREGVESGLNSYRKQIDTIDSQLLALFEQRMDVSEKIAALKKREGRQTLDASREAEKLEGAAKRLPESLRGYGRELQEKLMELSRRYQDELSKEGRGEGGDL